MFSGHLEARHLARPRYGAENETDRAGQRCSGTLVFPVSESRSRLCRALVPDPRGAPCIMLKTPILSLSCAAAALALGCAPAPQTPPEAPVVASAAEPASPGDPDAPRYKPSTSSATALDITTNAYGAYDAASGAPKIGDVAQDFTLPLADGGTFDLAQARSAGPVLVMFYRGFW